VSDAATLTLEGIAKRFGDTQALAGASFTVRPGSLHALLGENGAGKTTLMRIAFGLERPHAGTMRVGETPYAPRSPLDAIACGIGMVHQHFTIVPAMTVAENVALGGQGAYRAAEAVALVERIGGDTGLALDPTARAGDLPVGAQQRLEIVKALARGARTLILDEPTAVLAPQETADLLRMLRRFADGGGAVVLITHKLREALEAADAITVLRAGRTVWTGRPRETDARALARATVGELEAPTVRGPAHPGEPVLTARDVHARDARGVERLRGVSLEVRRGEIVGIAAVEGAGQHELLRALAGRTDVLAGSVTRPVRVAFIPEDRQRDGLVGPFTLTENIALRGAGKARGVVAWRALRARAIELLERFGVRPPDPDARASALSGGNQQRLVLARELGDGPDAVIAENPTRGLDVAATAATHRQLIAMRDAGAGVVVHTSDLDEVLALADRVIVLHGGRASAVAAERDAIAVAMLGGAA